MNGKKDEPKSQNGNRSREADTRPKRMKLSAEESLRRMKEFDKRREDFVAAIRKGKGGTLPA